MDWCKGREVVQPHLCLLLTGVTPQDSSDPEPLPDTALWDRWVDVDTQCPKDPTLHGARVDPKSTCASHNGQV